MTKNNNLLKIAFVTLTVLLTPFFVKIPNPISTGGFYSVGAAELMMLIVGALYSVKLLQTKQYKSPIFLGYVAIVALTALQLVALYLTFGKLIISITLLKILGFGVLTYLIVRCEAISKRQLLTGLFAALMVLNVYTLGYVLLTGVSIRYSAVLGNINIYIVYVFALVPFLIKAVRKQYFGRYTRPLFFATMVMTFAIVILSGSRISVYVLVIEFAMIAMVERANLVHLMKTSLAYVALTGLLVFVLVSVNDKLAYDLNRTFLAISGDVPTDVLEGQENNPNDTLEGSIYDPIIYNTYTVRQDIFKRSLQLIEAHPLTGVGKPVIIATGWGAIMAHNIFLEAFLNFGIPLGIAYLFLACYPFLYSLVYILKKDKSIEAFRIFLAFGTLGVVSMVQPIITDKFVVMLPMWAMFAFLHKESLFALLKSKRSKETNVVQGLERH